MNYLTRTASYNMYFLDGATHFVTDQHNLINGILDREQKSAFICTLNSTNYIVIMFVHACTHDT